MSLDPVYVLITVPTLLSALGTLSRFLNVRNVKPSWLQPLIVLTATGLYVLRERLEGGDTLRDAGLMALFTALGTVGLYHTGKKVALDDDGNWRVAKKGKGNGTDPTGG